MQRPRVAARLPILDRFVLGQMLAPFLFGIMSFTVILVAGDLLFRLAKLVIQNGVSLGTVLRLFLYSLPRVIVLTIPMSCLLASLLGFGSMSSNSELVALKSAGISFGRIIRPLAVAGVFISVIAFAMNETIVPASERIAANVLRYEALHRIPPVFREHVFIREASGGILRRVLYIGTVKPRTGDMTDILVQEFEDGKISRLITAPRGNWKDGAWWMYDGQVFDVGTAGVVSPLFSFERQSLSLSMTPSELDSSRADPSEMGIGELYATVRSAELQGDDTNELRMMLHLRIAVPWASVVLVLVGAAVGSRPQRSSSSIGLGLSVMIVFAYYVVMSIFKALGDAGFIPVIIAAWTPNASFLAVGSVLTRRANMLG
ncbi:MAG: LptF/LptG family permease [Synergistaceae bacterium]|jgi:lipopolysaccharide export system permease protein|nr:LptF/LptG family permease [Synergistaceae bacterium]